MLPMFPSVKYQKLQRKCDLMPKLQVTRKRVIFIGHFKTKQPLLNSTRIIKLMPLIYKQHESYVALGGSMFMKQSLKHAVVNSTNQRDRCMLSWV
mgnify:FL=1